MSFPKSVSISEALQGNGRQNAVGVRKSAEGRAPVAMQLVQLLQLVFFDTTDATSE